MLKRVKYLILGGGPSGLTVAHSLIDHGVPSDQVVLLEKESVAGGLCRSEMVDGAPLDIGGGHFLDLRKKEVLDFIFRFMPEHEWNTFVRVSKIRLRGQQIDHPLEANLWQFSRPDQVDYLESIAQAGCVRGEPMPESFADWVVWKLGARIAEEYMLPYNRKIWSLDPNELGTYWLYKLPDVSFRETLRSCLEGSPFGALPAHGTFMYPKEYGYGEVWRRMGVALGDSMVTDCPVQSIDLGSRTVNGRWQADTIINTVPWTLWPRFCQVPPEVQADIGLLRSIAVDVDYQPETLDTECHWIYEPDEAIAHHRLLVRSNFCTDSRGYWSETNGARSQATDGWRHHNEFAYPLNTIGKLEAVQRVLQWAAGHDVVGVGRWGRWEHMNS
ncbi:MAG: NAD(P)-binding protein, partial [Pseudomonadota bacterium]|nr:NAD(P)-binding protein [Pseudomonadota bacterium]